MTLCRGLFGFGLVLSFALGGWQPSDSVMDAAAAVPPVAWSPCYKGIGPDFQCGTVQVPLDHDNPAGASPPKPRGLRGRRRCAVR